MASRFSQSSATVVSSHLDDFANHEDGETESSNPNRIRDSLETARSSYAGSGSGSASGDNATTSMTTTSMAYLPQTVVFCELRHDGFEECVPSGPLESGLVSKWRPRDRVRCSHCPVFVCITFVLLHLFRLLLLHTLF